MARSNSVSLGAKYLLSPTSVNEVTGFSFGEYKNGGFTMVSKVGCAMVTAMGATLLEVEADVSGGPIIGMPRCASSRAPR